MLVGHKKQKDFLFKLAESNLIPHALIFEGESKIGKRKVALELIQKIFCENQNSCSCCRSCESVIKQTHPDLFFISTDGKEIKIEETRKLSLKFSLKPFSSSHKIAVIDDAHLMNIEAQNSILKTLEEPTNSSIVILITDQPEKLIGTIKSRAWRVKFFPVESKEIEKYLEKNGCEKECLEKIILFSFNRPGVAINFLENPDLIKERKQKIKNFLEIISEKTPFHLKIKYAKEMSEDIDQAKELMSISLNYFRALMLKKIEGDEINYSLKEIKKSINLIEDSINLISKTTSSSRSILERLIIKL